MGWGLLSPFTLLYLSMPVHAVVSTVVHRFHPKLEYGLEKVPLYFRPEKMMGRRPHLDHQQAGPSSWDLEKRLARRQKKMPPHDLVSKERPIKAFKVSP